MRLYLASPRGFCAGVVRAIEMVERALQRFGAPIYVKHEIVHNRHVLEELQQKGVVFVEDLSLIPEGSVLIYSAHGVSPEVRKEAKERKLKEIDATCPLVTRNHSAVKRLSKMGKHILLIGHKKHVEVVAAAQEAPDAVTIVESIKEIDNLHVPEGKELYYLTQTTLSCDEVEEISSALRKKFPLMKTLSESMVCYATTNRQMALKELLSKVDLVLVIGDPKSSNSNRLKEMAEKRGVLSYLLHDAFDLKKEWLSQGSRIGMTAGASTPERIVQNVIRRLYEMGLSSVEEISFCKEKVLFPIVNM